MKMLFRTRIFYFIIALSLGTLTGCMDLPEAPTPTLPPVVVGGAGNADFNLLTGPLETLEGCANKYNVVIYDPDGILYGSVMLEYSIYDAVTEELISTGRAQMELTFDNYTIITSIDTTPPNGSAGKDLVRYRFIMVDVLGNAEVSRWYEYQDALNCGE